MTAKRKTRRPRQHKRVDAIDAFHAAMRPVFEMLAEQLGSMPAQVPTADGKPKAAGSAKGSGGARREQGSRAAPAIESAQPVTFAPALGVVPNRAQVAVVVCQAIRAAGLQPVRCNSCDSMHLDLVPARRHIHTDELTPSVLRACRLIPEDVLAAWEAAV